MSFRIHILVWILHGLVHALVNPYGVIIVTQGLFVAYLALYKGQKKDVRSLKLPLMLFVEYV